MGGSRSQHYANPTPVVFLGVDDPFVFNFISFHPAFPVQSVSTATVNATAMFNGIEIQCTDGSVVNGESDKTTILVIGDCSCM